MLYCTRQGQYCTCVNSDDGTCTRSVCKYDDHDTMDDFEDIDFDNYRDIQLEDN